MSIKLDLLIITSNPHRSRVPFAFLMLVLHGYSIICIVPNLSHGGFDNLTSSHSFRTDGKREFLGVYSFAEGVARGRIGDIQILLMASKPLDKITRNSYA